jgi:hypothetical protein
MEKDLILNLSPIAFTKLISKGVITNVKNDDYLKIVGEYLSKPKTQPLKVVVTETNKPASASRSVNSNTNDKPFTKAVGDKNVSTPNTVNKLSLDFSQPIRTNWYEDKKPQNPIKRISSLEKDSAKQGETKAAVQPESETKPSAEKSEVKKERKSEPAKTNPDPPKPKAAATQQEAGGDKSSLNKSAADNPESKKEEIPKKEPVVPKGKPVSKKNTKSKPIPKINFEDEVDEKKVFTNTEKKEDLPLTVPVEQTESKDKTSKPDTAKKVASEVAKRLEKLNIPIEENDLALLEKLIEGIKPSQKGIILKNKKFYDLLQGSSNLLFKLDAKEITSLTNVVSYKGENAREEMKDIVKKYSTK